jgi:hypothetical protein
MTPKKIVKGSRVKLSGMKGWWLVVEQDGTGLTCTRKIRGTQGSTDQIWTDVDQVTHVSNLKLKRKGIK